MRFAFKRLPGATEYVPRPTLDVSVLGPMDSITALCLVDSGTLHNRFGSWIADLVGIDVSDVERETIGVAGTVVSSRTVPVSLQLGEFRWEAPVSFCDPWPFDFQLLGQLGFLRWFVVQLDVANETIDVVPHTQ